MNARRWNDALLGAALFAVAPFELNGIHLRSRPGPAQEAWFDSLRRMANPDFKFRRMPGSVTAERLVGGMDLAATLASSKPVHRDGILAESNGGIIIAPMADRMDLSAACSIASAFDTREVRIERDSVSATLAARFALIVIDESDQSDDKVHSVLLDRLSVSLDLEGFSLIDLESHAFDYEQILSARAMYKSVSIQDKDREILVRLGFRMGLVSLRPIIFASAVACAHAALFGRLHTEETDILVATRLVLLPRALMLPEEDVVNEEVPPEPLEETEKDYDDGEVKSLDKPLEDQVLDAAVSQIPDNLLDKIHARQPRVMRGAREGKAGEVGNAQRRGRPAGVRRGGSNEGQRLNIIETLRAAAPFQKLRKAGLSSSRVRVMREDFRYTRFKHRTETTAIFVVDASGSSALHRLAEVKGAVQLVLADCYVRRDEIALISFRGTKADLLLPPTRSLVRAKRQLISLPGGGGTPLASGLQSALLIADGARRKGRSPLIVVMTDGSANVALDGRGGRKQAEEDALNAARMIFVAGIGALMIDTSPRPREQAKKIADEMHADYLLLPNAQRNGVVEAVKTAVLGGVK